MKFKCLTIAAALGAGTLMAVPAAATGKMKCDVAKEDMRPMAELSQALEAKGWEVRKAKVDGGCYEVYGTDPEGRRVEAYFDPASFEKLLVSQRGKILFKKD